MGTSRAALDLAAFLDSEEARSLADVPLDHRRRVAELFLELAYGELGKKPALLFGEEVEELVGRVLPTRIAPGEPWAEHAVAVLEAFFRHLELTEVVTQAYEVRQGLERGGALLHEALKSGSHADAQVRTKQDPFVHGAKKLGRNDPCSCGSGRKYKKCHGKNA